MFDNKNINIRDKPKALTAEDLIRRFKLDSLAKDRQAIKTLNDGLTKTDTIIENFVNNVAMYCQDQEDGFITSWFLDEIPTLENKPYIDFDKDNLSNYINDLYYNRDNGKVYQFVNNEDEYQWQEIDDDYLRESLSIASKDVDTNDNKRNIYFTLPSPPYDAGDIWYDGDNINRCRCSRKSGLFHETDWCLQKDFSDSCVLVETNAVLDEFKIEVERDYATKALLETTQSSITASVEATATEIINMFNDYATIENVRKEIESVNVNITSNTFNINALSEKYSTLASDLSANEKKVADFELNLDKIEQQVSYFDEQAQAIAKLSTSIEGIEAQIGSITNITVSANGIGNITLNNVLTSELLYLQIYPTSEDLSYLNLSPITYLSNNTKLTSRDLLFINTKTNETTKYTLPCNLYYISNDVKDELIIDFEKEQLMVIHRVGINAETGEKYALSASTTKFYDYKGIDLIEGDYTIKMQSFNSAYINARALASSIYTAQYATRVEVNNAIKLSEEGIKQEINGKVTDLDGNVKELKGSLELKLNTKDLCTELNARADKISFIGDRFSWKSTYSSMSENGTLKATNVDLSGKITASSGSFSGTVVTSNITATGGTIGGFKLTSNSIYRGSNALGTSGSGNIYLGTNGLSISNTFKVSNSGILTASNVDLSGKITATSGSFTGTITTTNITATGGKIGGASLNNYGIYFNNGSTGWGLWGTTAHANIVFHAGANSTNIGGAPFRVMHDGTVYASKINVTNGSITGGTVAGFNVANNRLYYGNTVINRNGNVEFRNDNGYFSIGSGAVLLNGSGPNQPLVLSDMLGNTTKGDVNSSVEIRCYYGNARIRSNEYAIIEGGLGTFVAGQNYGGASTKATKDNLQILSKEKSNEIYNIVKNLQFYQYDYKEKYGGQKNNIGFLIDDIENTLLNDYLHIRKREDDKDFRNYNCEDLTRIILMLVQQLQNKIEQLESR